MAPVIGVFLLVHQGLDVETAIEILLVKFFDLLTKVGIVLAIASIPLGAYYSVKRLRSRVLATVFGVALALLLAFAFYLLTGDIQYNYQSLSCWAVY